MSGFLVTALGGGLVVTAGAQCEGDLPPSWSVWYEPEPDAYVVRRDADDVQVRVLKRDLYDHAQPCSPAQLGVEAIQRAERAHHLAPHSRLQAGAE